MNEANRSGTTASTGYQIALTSLLSLNFGIVFFDRNALNFLMPFVQPELGLNNEQVGILAGALSFTWALAALGIGYISDRTGSRKGLLIGATVAFSVCSFLSGIAGSFVALLGARLLMGVAEGGVMPISQSLIASEVKPAHRGLAMGVAQNLGSNLMGSFVAPVALTAFAVAYGWRHAFYLAAAPGLIAALLMWFFVRTPPPEPRVATAQKLSVAEAFAERNVLLCVIIGVLLVSYLVVCWAFMPLYLTQVRHYDPETGGWLMGVLGISATIGAFVVSGLSDRIGRRPLMILLPFVGVILPLGAMWFDGSVWVLAAIFFFGWALNGIFPLFMATVPSESVSREHLAVVLGLCMGIPEVIGGVFAPWLAGKVADQVGLNAPLWIMFGLAIAAGIVALGLRETAPRVLAARGVAAPARAA
jgi:predicted MFS family arabinose efflux permease